MWKNTLNILKLCAPKNVTCSLINLSLLSRHFPILSKQFHITSNSYGKSNDRSLQRRLMPKMDEGTEGENIFEMGSSIDDIFPDENTPNRLFKGIPFKKLPICNIRVSKNNTILSLTNFDGKVQMIYSCGIEGFKNARKGTNIAAQSTALTFGNRLITAGYKTLRVRIQGLGPGRLSSIKGLEMSGLNIVSVTDSTKICWYPLRPPKPRRI